MGNKIISYLIVLVLLTYGLSIIVGGTLGSNKDNQILSTRTVDFDNSFKDATELFDNANIDGSVDTDDDQMDFYKFDLRRTGQMGDRLLINFTINQSMGMVILLFINPEFYDIGDDFVSTFGNNPIDRTLVACDSGYYYLVIVGFFPTTIDYNIKVDIRTIFRTIDTDNTNATANSISGSSSIQNTLNPVSDYLDLYEVSLTSGTTTTDGLIVELTDFQDKYLAVYRPDGSLLEYSDETFGNPGDPEIIKFTADQTGNYRIAVGISGHPPQGSISYTLNTTLKSGIPVDDDYDKDHATRVYDGTLIYTSFDSEFDEYDYFVMELNDTDNLTVSILYEPGPADLDIEILDPDDWWINDVTFYDEEKGVWTYGISELNSTDHHIEVRNWNLSLLVNYSIFFSLNGENLWFQDEPMTMNDTNLDFSMPEDTIDESQVNLTHIFFDPDSPITFASESHNGSVDMNLTVEILSNGTVKFTPDNNYFGSETVNFSATDINQQTLFWGLNVTVLPVNDAPIITTIEDQFWTQDTPVNMDIIVTDVDDSELTFTDNTTLFDVEPVNKSVNFIPTNEQVGTHYINITASDGEYNASVLFIAEIININDPPKFLSIGGLNPIMDGVIKFNASEDKWNNYTIEALDIDLNIGASDELRFSSNSLDPAFNIDEQNGNISFFPLQKHVGEFNITITLTDGKGGAVEQNISFLVKNVNDSPEIPEIIVENIDGYTVNCSIESVSDEDGDTVTYWWDFGDGSTVKDLGLFGNHTYAESGEYIINVTVTDGNGGLGRNSIIVNVTGSENGDGTNGNKTDIIDVDKDGLDDFWEMEHFGNLSYGANDDPDNDGYSNLKEFEGETNPTKDTDRPLDDKDKSKGGKDAGGISEGAELFLWIIGIIGIVNLILILSIIGFLVIRKKPKEGTAPMEGRVAGPRKDEFTVPCPECGQYVPENVYECPYCGEELEPYTAGAEPKGREDYSARGRRTNAAATAVHADARGAGKAHKPRRPTKERARPAGRRTTQEEYDYEETEDDEEGPEWEIDEEDQEPTEVEEMEEEWDEEELEEWPEDEVEEELDEEYYEEESEPVEDDEWGSDEEEYYEEDDEPVEEDREDYYDEDEEQGGDWGDDYDERYREDYYDDKRNYQDNYKPSDSWGRHESKPAWDSGRGARRFKRQ
jgi:hypothetical protein